MRSQDSSSARRSGPSTAPTGSVLTPCLLSSSRVPREQESGAKCAPVVGTLINMQQRAQTPSDVCISFLTTGRESPLGPPGLRQEPWPSAVPLIHWLRDHTTWACKLEALGLLLSVLARPPERPWSKLQALPRRPCLGLLSLTSLHQSLLSHLPGEVSGGALHPAVDPQQV